MRVSDESTLAKMDGAATPLAQIADALKCPVEAFLDPAQVLADLQGAREVLQLWAALGPRDRERALEAMRKLLQPD